MKIGVFLVILALLAAPATTGHAAADATKLKPAAKLKLPTGLRGSVPAPAAQPEALPTALAPLTPAARALKPPVALATPITAPTPDVGQCRIDCAHSYYFCPSEPSSTECSSAWSQCVTGCSHPPLTIERLAGQPVAGQP